MYCSKCGKELNENAKFCDSCGTKVEGKEKVENEEKAKKKSSNATIIVVILIAGILAICVVVGIIIMQKNKNIETAQTDTTMQTSQSGQTTKENKKETAANKNTDKSFFELMYESKGKLTDRQKLILDYFDNDYFALSSADYNSLQRNPKIYKTAKVQAGFDIIKVVKSTDEECEVIGRLFYADDDGDGFYNGELNMDFEEKTLLKMKQLDERLVAGDVIRFYGTYEDVTSVTVDGKEYIIPTINANKIIKIDYSNEDAHRFKLSDIEKVATAIFDENVKLRKSVYMEDSNNPQFWCYTAVLENQSNSNFSEFNLGRDLGYIEYSEKTYDYSKCEKEFVIGADFEHYMVFTYDKELKKIYIDYYNKKYEKEWQRKIDLQANRDGYDHIVMSYDYSKDKLAFNLENDLYLIDLKTGEDLITPILVGEKLRVVMQNNGIILIGNDNKDAIMKVDYKGNILQRNDISTKMKMYGAEMQYVGKNLVVKLYGSIEANDNNPYGSAASKFVIIKEDGTIDTVTSDQKY